MNKMTEDTRRIQALNDNNNAWTVAMVGDAGVTKIECYEENGPFAPVPYFAIWDGDHLRKRVCGNGISVRYFNDIEG